LPAFLGSASPKQSGVAESSRPVCNLRQWLRSKHGGLRADSNPLFAFQQLDPVEVGQDRVRVRDSGMMKRLRPASLRKCKMVISSTVHGSGGLQPERASRSGRSVGRGCDRFERDGGPQAASACGTSMDSHQVAPSGMPHPSCRSGEKLSASRGLCQLVAEHNSEIESFFRQLWMVPKPRVSSAHPNLWWIRRDLWESKKFGP
jgi:hypothetical protein